MTTARKISRPKRYTADEVHKASLYCLYRDFDVEDVLQMSCSDNPDDLVAKMIHGYRFARADGTHINYFKTIQDIASNQPYPTLKEFLLAFQKLIDERKVSINDICIVPFVLVRNGRNHFNTLVLKGNGDNVIRAHIIESYGTRRGLDLHKYPMNQARKEIRAAFSPNYCIKVSQMKVGVQFIFDDNNCGAHQVNFTEAISHMNGEAIFKKSSLKTVLGLTHLIRRNLDTLKIKVLSLINPFSANSNPVVEKNEKRNTSIDIDSGHFEMMDINEAVVEMNSLEVVKEQAKVVREIEESKQQSLYDAAIYNIDTNYLALHSDSTFHTRSSTAEFIKQLLEEMRDKSMDEKEKRATVIKLLMACYKSIADKNSQLRVCLESILARFLDCEAEVLTISGSLFSFLNDGHGKIKEIFDQRLHVYGIKDDDYNILKAQMKHLNQIDTGFSYKFFDSVKKNADKHRGFAFVAIRNMLGLPNEFLNRFVKPVKWV